MIKLNEIIILSSLICSGCSTLDNTYMKIGTGIKKETQIDWSDGGSSSPISARIEIGKRSGPWTYGVSHHSQWLEGWPINSNDEYSKTEVFVDYEWKFKYK